MIGERKEQKSAAIRKNLAENLKLARKYRKLSARELAEKSGVSFYTIGRIEREEKDITFCQVELLAIALDCEMLDLIYDEDFETNYPELSEFSLMRSGYDVLYGDAKKYQDLYEESLLTIEDLNREKGALVEKYETEKAELNMILVNKDMEILALERKVSDLEKRLENEKEKYKSIVNTLREVRKEVVG